VKSRSASMVTVSASRSDRPSSSRASITLSVKVQPVSAEHGARLGHAGSDAISAHPPRRRSQRSPRYLLVLSRRILVAVIAATFRVLVASSPTGSGHIEVVHAIFGPNPQVAIVRDTGIEPISPAIAEWP
jgi:hypothetical protein